MLTPKKSFEIDEVQIKFLAVQTAATLLFICESRDPGADDGPDRNNGEGYDPIAVILSSYQNWAPHGYTNSLQTMAELLYDYVQLLVDDLLDSSFVVDPSDRRIIADALTAYQTWKTAHIAAEKAKLGAGYEQFGDATGFNQKDWSDLNERLLEPVTT